MVEWVLVLAMSSTSGSAALHSIPGFNSYQECEKAGREIVEGLKFSYIRFTCIKREKINEGK